MRFVRVTTVDSVTEKNIYFLKNRRKQLLRALFDRNLLIYPTTRPHDLCATLHNNKTCETKPPSCTDHLPKNATFDESSHYEVYSIATPSLTTPHALTFPPPHSISTTSNETE